MGGPTRYFEDFAAGDRFETAGLTLSEALIVEFARFVKILYTTLNQRGETVSTLIGNQLCRRRPPGEGRSER